MPGLFLWVFVLGVGASVGSFLNVCVHRLPDRRSIVRPGSACPACGHPIAWHDNIPLLSYVLLRGRCRHCRARISPRYPLVEAATALLFALLFARHGLSPDFVRRSCRPHSSRSSSSTRAISSFPTPSRCRASPWAS